VWVSCERSLTKYQRQVIMNNNRHDGRKGLLRPSRLTFDPISRSDGSVELVMGFTHILAAVYGLSTAPANRQSAVKGLNVDINMVNGKLNDASSTENSIRKLVRTMIRGEECGAQSIQLYIVILNDDGSVEAAILSAVIGAIIRARPPLRSWMDDQYFWAISALKNTDGDWILDPTKLEETLSCQKPITFLVGDAESRLVNKDLLKEQPELETLPESIYSEAVNELSYIHKLVLVGF